MQKKDPEFRTMFARDTRAVWIERSGTGKEGTISSRFCFSVRPNKTALKFLAGSPSQRVSS